MSTYASYVTKRPEDAGAYFHYGKACYDLSIHYIGVGGKYL